MALEHPRALAVCLWLVMIAAATPAVVAQAGLFGSSLSEAMVVSVSSSGRHAVSSHRERELVLWDLEQRTHEVVSEQANIYSAYFVPGREAFLWQDLDNVVRVTGVDGEELLAFEHFPTYGHLITGDLETYVASDEGWGIHVGWGDNLRTLKGTDGRAFLGYGKLLNLALAPDGETLLSSGDGLVARDERSIAESSSIVAGDRFTDFSGVVLWNLQSGQAAHKLPGNRVKTHATLSPDGQQVVSVDENLGHYVWRTDSGEKAYEVSTIGSGIWQPSPDPNDLGTFDASGVRIEFPEDFDTGYNSEMLAVQFLDEDYYAGFHPDEPYASLWRLGDPYALRMLDLGTDPFPATDSYARNAAIDTAPEANILVTGQRASGGINVYRFDPERQTLERIWAPEP